MYFVLMFCLQVVPATVMVYAALTYTEYPLRILKAEIHTEKPNVMRIDGAGLVENDVIAKTLRMLSDRYKCLKNVAIDCHPHCRIFENALRMLRTLTNVLQIMRTSCKHMRMKRLCSASILANNINDVSKLHKGHGKICQY